MGFSTAAMALAAPGSRITAVDLCDTVPEHTRVSFWSGLGLTNIVPVAGDAGAFLVGCQPGQFDLIFHDAVHGPAAFREYTACAEIASVVAIHDFEQLPEEMRAAVRSRFSRVVEDVDHKGRVLFLGTK